MIGIARIFLISFIPIYSLNIFAQERYSIEVPGFPQKVNLNLPIKLYCEGKEDTGFEYTSNKWIINSYQADNRNDFSITINTFGKIEHTNSEACDNIKNIKLVDKKNGVSLCGIISYPKESTKTFALECKPNRAKDRTMIFCKDDLIIYPQTNTAFRLPSEISATFNNFNSITRYQCKTIN